MEIREAHENDIEKLIPTLLELRPHLDPSQLKERFRSMITEGYKLVYIGDDKMAFSLAGFRILNIWFSGKTLYIDDLVTHSAHQKNGYAGQLLNWLKEHARQQNCDHFSLDSGFTRKKAYRLYLNQGLEVESLHFGRKVIDL